MKKKIEICTGTACYVLGAADLLDIEDYLEPELSNKIEIFGMCCNKFCQSSNQKPPFVRIDNQVYGDMTINTLLKLLRGE